MVFSFTCPLEGCGQKMTVEAANQEEAAEKLTMQAREHLASAHPDIQKTDEQVKTDITSMMVPEEGATQ